MKQDIKICLPLYKIVYSTAFLLILSLIRGVSCIDEIGGVLDSNIALLAIVFCAETYVIERSGNRWEIFALFPMENKKKVIVRRVMIQNLYLFFISLIGYLFFYGQKRYVMNASPYYLYGIYAAAIIGTIIFWSILSMTISNLFRNQWIGIGISLVLWLTVSSKFGEKALGSFNIFAFGFRDLIVPYDVSWLWGKAAGVLIAVFLLGAATYILKKRG